MIGRRFAHYVIVDTIAAGGMGVVYRARDEHLDRDVALKVLPAEANEGPVAKRRFRREALALSKLRHPNIATVYDFSEEDGVSFLVMELVEGESLAEHLERGPLPEPDIRRFGAQIAAALEAAHRAGVVHRDLKPANVMIDSDGDVRVLDFGIARLAAPAGGTDTPASLLTSATAPGILLGTLPYMAPEQLLDEPVDGRADIHALGVVMHEMATGHMPWQQAATTALIYEIMNTPAARVRDTRPEVSTELDEVISRCLAKSPDDRFATAHEVKEALEGRMTAADIATPRPLKVAPLKRSRAWIVMISAFALALPVFFGPRNGCTVTDAPVSLAVLPLENLSGDPAQDYFVDGMTDGLINRLTQIEGLSVIARPSVMRYKTAGATLPEIGDQLRVRRVITGSVQFDGNHVRIRVQLADAASSENLWADTFESGVEDVQVLQASIAGAIAEELDVRLSDEERERLDRTETVDPRAHEAYLRGRYYLDWTYSPEWGRSLDYFTEAIQIDPQYAPAYAGIAEAYTLMSNVYMPSTEALSKAKAAALRAIALDSTVVEAWAALAYVSAFHEWNWDEADANFERALELSPGRASTRRDHGIYLLARGRVEEAEAEIQRAWELDPLSPYTTTVRLFPLYEGRRFDEAITTARSILQADSTLAYARMILGQSLLMTGDTEAALVELTRSSDRDGGANPVLRAWLGYALVEQGFRDSARTILAELEDADPADFVSPVAPALLRTALGDHGAALSWLEQAVQQRYEDVLLVHLDAGFDALHDDPRFAEILEPVGLMGERSTDSAGEMR